MTASILYDGGLRCFATHLQSGTVIETDAPTDNRGKGERFSPTDLLCVSLGICMITTIAMKAGDLGIEVKNTTLEITKHMLGDPRRVGKIDVFVKFLTSVPAAPDHRAILEKTGENCPVAKSLHPDVAQNITYTWSEG